MLLCGSQSSSFLALLLFSRFAFRALTRASLESLATSSAALFRSSISASISTRRAPPTWLPRRFSLVSSGATPGTLSASSKACAPTSEMPVPKRSSCLRCVRWCAGSSHTPSTVSTAPPEAPKTRTSASACAASSASSPLRRRERLLSHGQETPSAVKRTAAPSSPIFARERSSTMREGSRLTAVARAKTPSPTWLSPSRRVRSACCVPEPIALAMASTPASAMPV
mmetsp:Transcript_48026/g.155322  ORF Transcript_48026/g.155322 Transcript_48026/m.155322 type:complete len:226 (-) Transcript_48026:307-984(-)